MIGRFVTRLVDAQAGWARPFGDFNHRWLSALFRPIRPIKDFLNGTWLGHPVHSALTDVPIGALTIALVLDVIGQPVAADVALLVAVLSIVAAAVAGFADYTDTDGTARMRATVHASLMTVSLVIFAISLIMRAGNPIDRTLPFVLLVVGYLVITAGAAVGGDLAGQPPRLAGRRLEVGAARPRRPRRHPGGRSDAGKGRPERTDPHPDRRDDPRPPRHVRTCRWATARGHACRRHHPVSVARLEVPAHRRPRCAWSGDVRPAGLRESAIRHRLGGAARRSVT